MGVLDRYNKRKKEEQGASLVPSVTPRPAERGSNLSSQMGGVAERYVARKMLDNVQNNITKPSGTIGDDAVKPTVSPVRKPTVTERAIDTFGYVTEKAARGVLEGIEGVTDFAYTAPLSILWGLSSGFGAFENPASKKINEWINQINQDDVADYFKPTEESYGMTPKVVKEWGWLPETVGQMAPFIAETVATGGVAAADDLALAGKSAIGSIKNFVRNPDTHFGMSAAGGSTEEALNKGANPLTATIYGAASGALEMTTEKLFGGLAGTGVGKSFVDFTSKKPFISKALDILGEGAEEMIVTGVDPILQRATGVDTNAEWASIGDYIESGVHGAILSGVMNASLMPLQRYGRDKVVSDVNKSTAVLNELTDDTAPKMLPLPVDATEEEILDRQAEIRTVALAYNNAVSKAAQNEQTPATDSENQEITNAIDEISVQPDAPESSNEITIDDIERVINSLEAPANVDVPAAAAPVQTDSSTPAVPSLRDQLASLDQIDIDGIRYAVRQDKATGKWYGNIKRVSPSTKGAVPIENARGTVYSSYGKGFPSREDAVNDITAVAERSGLVSAPVGSAPSAMVDNAVDNTVDAGLKNVEDVKELSSYLGKAGKKIIPSMYDQGQNVTDYFKAMNDFYNLGKKNPEALDRSIFSSNPTISPSQAEAAFIAGQADAENAKKTVAPADGIVYNEGGNLQAYTALPVPTGQPDDGKTVQRDLANAIRKWLDDPATLAEIGGKITSQELFKVSDTYYGGTMAEGKYTVKDAYDALELAVNSYLIDSAAVKKWNGDASVAGRALSSLHRLMNLLPTQTKRTEEMQQFQQFSTPPTIAYMAAWAANVNSNDVVVEPSAGIGGLALFPKAWGATVYGNEYSKRRLAFLDELGLDGTFNLNAEQLDNLLPERIKPSIVIMNPPFSSTAGRTLSNKTSNATRHIEQALERLEPSGRLVAILGRGMSDDAPSFKKWWSDIKGEYDVKANIQINGSNYTKYGTSFDVQLVVIDKTGPQKGKTLTGVVNDMQELPAMLEGIRNERLQPGRVLETAVHGNANSSSVRGGDSSELRNGIDRKSDTKRVSEPMGQSRFGEEESLQSGDVSGRDSGSASVPHEAARSGEGKSGRGVSERGTKADARTDVRGVQRSDDNGAVDGSSKPGVPTEQVTLEKAAKQRSEREKKALVENVDNVYATYTPSKVRIKGSQKHPAKLVESAAMAAVVPPDPKYSPRLPKDIVESGALSDAQLENIVYAGQAHDQINPDGTRKGYFIGDGTGVGKGRQIAGVILDNFNNGRKKAVWVSKNAPLFNDAVRDWEGLGQDKTQLFMQGKLKVGGPIDKKEGILFTTYPLMSNGWGKEKGINTGRRFEDIVDWLGKDFDGVIAFDEVHQAGNAIDTGKGFSAKKASNVGLSVIELQKRLPKARILYVSATGATEVSNYAYLQRLGLWGKGTAFSDVKDFIGKISEGGLAAMELVAQDLKSLGLYLARSISYEDVVYDRLDAALDDYQVETYDAMAEAWQIVIQNIEKAVEATGGGRVQKMAAMNRFYTSAQSFFNKVITSMKMPALINAIREDLANGKSVLVQMTSTDEAQLNRSMSSIAEHGGDLEEVDTSPLEIITDYVNKFFPIIEQEEYEDEAGKVRIRDVLDAEGNPVISKKALRMRDELLAKLKMMNVPDGALDMLINTFGAENVSEITGRTRRIIPGKDANGNTIRVEDRRSDSARDLDSKAFQEGKKRILVFSEAGGTGRSYHADLRAKNQQQRVHYLLQPGWKADAAVQGLGRAHRSNQASAPIIRLVASTVPGEKRFLSTIAKRLDQLGALTKGQRETGSGVFTAGDNLEGKNAADALQAYYKVMPHDSLKRLGLYEKLYDEFGRYNDKSDIVRDVRKFLNRLLMLPIKEQETVLDGYMEYLETAINTAKENGTLDLGLENVRADKAEVVDENVIREDSTGAQTKYVQLKISNKPTVIPYNDVADNRHNFIGLYNTADGSVRAVYELSSRTSENGKVEKRYMLQSPSKEVFNTYVESTFKAKCQPIPKGEWRAAWKTETGKLPEYIDQRIHMLSGTLLPVWDKLPPESKRVMRVITTDGRQYLGMIVKPSTIDQTLRSFGATRTREIFTPKQVTDKVLKDNMVAIFRDDRLKLKRARVSGEWRIELTSSYAYKYYRDYQGLVQEMINYNYRFFVPTGETGERIIGEIIKDNPIIDIVTPKNDVLEYREPTSDDGSASDPASMWNAERVGDKNKKPKSISEIISGIRRDFGFHITEGHVRGSGVRGRYGRSDKGIRTKSANDLPIVAHELGHGLNDRYGILDQKLPENVRDELLRAAGDMAKTDAKARRMSEGFAEWTRLFLQNRETARIDFPNLTDHVLRSLSAKDLALFEKLADDVNAYYSLDADTATSSIRLREDGGSDHRTPAEKIQDMGHSVYQAWEDSNHGIKLFDDATGSSVYKLASNSAYSDAVASRIIVDDLTDMNGQYVAPGLRSALEGINLKNDKENMDFGEYLTVRHGVEYLAEGMRVFADDRKNSTAWMENRRAQLEEQYPEFAAAAERIYKFIGDLNRTWGVGTGLMSEKTLNEWQKRWPDYVPFYRAISKDGKLIGPKRGFANQSNPHKRAKGGGQDIIHPIDNIISQIVMLVNVGTRNNVMRSLRDASIGLEANACLMERIPTPFVPKTFNMSDVKQGLSNSFFESGLGEEEQAIAGDIIANISDVMLQFERGKAHGNVVTVMVNGEKEFWKVNDPLLLESITSLSPPKLRGILDAYAGISRFITGNITGKNLVWSIFSNSLRDLQTLLTYSPNKNPLRVLRDITSSYFNKVMGDSASPLFKEYLAMGGGEASYYSADRKMTRKARDTITKARKKYLNPMNWISAVGDTIEMGPRFSTYKYLRENGVAPQDAFYAAMDVTINFRRSGRLSREMNAIVPFFNAGLQGLDKFRRYITAQDVPVDDRKKTAIIRATLYVTVCAVLGALFYAMNNYDDEAKEDYQQLSNYTKNSFWCIPIGDGKYFAIPKPQNLAVPASFFESALEYTAGGNKHAFDEFGDYFANNCLPNVVDDVAKGAAGLVMRDGDAVEDALNGAVGSLGLFGTGAYLMANKDFLGKPIVPNGMQYLLAKDQYNERTSLIAKTIGGAFNISPMKVDYAGKSVFGGFWTTQKALLPVGEAERDFFLGVANTYVKDNQYSTDLINRIFDRAESSQKDFKSDPSDISKSITAKMDSKQTEFYSTYSKLAKNTPESDSARRTRQTVLDIMYEYEKAAEAGYKTHAQSAVYAVIEATGATELLPSVMNPYVKDSSKKQHDLSAAQYVEFQTDYNALYWNYVEDHLEPSMSIREKTAVIRSAKEIANAVAKDKALKRNGASMTSGLIDKYGSASPGNIVTFDAQLDLADDDGSLKQDEVIEIIKIMVNDGLPYDEAYALFHARYPKSDKNNPWSKYAPQ